MDDVRNSSGLLRRGWLRLMDGEQPWGSIDIRPDRFGVTRYRLVVYPPGISESERRRVRAARGWPLWGVLVWIVSEIFVSQVTAPWTALAVSMAIALGLGVVAMVMAGGLRGRVRTMGAMVMVGYHEPASVAGRDRVVGLAASLIEADERLADGLLSPIEHEAIWWGVYDQMGQVSPAVRRSGGVAQ